MGIEPTTSRPFRRSVAAVSESDSRPSRNMGLARDSDTTSIPNVYTYTETLNCGAGAMEREEKKVRPF